MKLNQKSRNLSKKIKKQKNNTVLTQEIEVKKDIKHLRFLKNFEKILIEEKKAFNISDEETNFIIKTLENELETHNISSLCYAKFLILLNRYNCAYKFWNVFENIFYKKDSIKLIKLFNENIFDDFYPEFKLLKSEEWNVMLSNQFLLFYDFIHINDKSLLFSEYFHFYSNENTILSLEKLKLKLNNDNVPATNNSFNLFSSIQGNLVESTVQIPCWDRDKIIIIEIDLMELLIKIVTNTLPYNIEKNYMIVFKKIHKFHIKIAHIYLNE